MDELIKGEQVYEGKAKILYKSDDPRFYVQYFKDDATAFNGVKKGQIAGKGAMNCQISARLFEVLHESNIKTHFVKLFSEREMIVFKAEVIPLEVVVRNVVAGGLAKRMGLPEGQPLKKPMIEFYYKRDDLGDPLVTLDHIREFNLATEADLEVLMYKAKAINAVLDSFLEERNLKLVDFKLEFGRFRQQLILVDEISPDTCRFWDASSGEKLDKDRFRRDLGGVEEAYQEILRRVTQASVPQERDPREDMKEEPPKSQGDA